MQRAEPDETAELRKQRGRCADDVVERALAKDVSVAVDRAHHLGGALDVHAVVAAQGDWAVGTGKIELEDRAVRALGKRRAARGERAFAAWRGGAHVAFDVAQRLIGLPRQRGRHLELEVDAAGHRVRGAVRRVRDMRLHRACQRHQRHQRGQRRRGECRAPRKAFGKCARQRG